MMKASELIEELQNMISEHGDLDVFLTDWSEEYNQPANAVSVQFSISTRSGQARFLIDAR